jgi:hypothetical protein
MFKDGHRKEVKIVEIGKKQVKYYEHTDLNELLLTIDRAQLYEITDESGLKTEESENPIFGDNYDVNDSRNAIKINFTAILDHTTILTYERVINPYSSFEADLKINVFFVLNVKGHF